MEGNITYLSTITLDINDLNSLIKRYRMVSWIKKSEPTTLSFMVFMLSFPFKENSFAPLTKNKKQDLTILCLKKCISLKETNTDLG
jgi:hypothetical protein